MIWNKLFHKSVTSLNNKNATIKIKLKSQTLKMSVSNLKNHLLSLAALPASHPGSLPTGETLGTLSTDWWHSTGPCLLWGETPFAVQLATSFARAKARLLARDLLLWGGSIFTRFAASLLWPSVTAFSTFLGRFLFHHTEAKDGTANYEKPNDDDESYANQKSTVSWWKSKIIILNFKSILTYHFFSHLVQFHFHLLADLHWR